MKTNRFLALAVSAAVWAALSACSSNEPRPAEPAPEQAAAPVQPPAAEEAQEAKEAQGPYLYELLEQPQARKVWARMSAGRKGKGAPAWIRKGEGPTEPAHQTDIGGTSYWQGSLCQQHNCPNTFFYLLGENKAYGLHADFSNLRKVRPVIYGAPPAAERAALQNAYKQELARQQDDQ